MHHVRITFGPSDDAQHWHRIGNFKEDLYRQLELTGMGAVADIDRTAPPVLVTVNHSRDLGTALAIIKEEIRRHNFISQAVVTREWRRFGHSSAITRRHQPFLSPLRP